MDVLFFDDINASHAATGYPGRSDLPGFHVFTLEDTYPHTRPVMPPYRFDFYQIVWFKDAPDANLQINTRALRGLSQTLSFASPDHVLSWVRGEAQRGFIVYFKAAFLLGYPHPILPTFRFFAPDTASLVPVTPPENATLQGHFQRLLDVFNASHPYRVPMLQAYLLALLFDCRRLYDDAEETQRQQSPGDALTARFRQLIPQHYLVRKQVRDYADLLAVTPDYLGQVVRASTGKTPSKLIAEHLLLESQKLLLYTDLNIGEVAVQLGFNEPTHFGRFFRKQTGQSPGSWRDAQP